MMVVLKHLAQEFQMDPFKVRQVLRAKFGYAPKRRWKWEDDDPELIKARNHLKLIKEAK